MTRTDTELPTAKLESRLSAELGTEVVETEVLHDGLNLTVGISTGDDRAYVLRRPNKLRESGLFNEPEREYELLRRLRDTSVDAPTPVLFCDDESLLGDRFFVTTRLDGEAIPLGSDLPARFRNERARGRVADLLIDELAEIHSLNADRFEDVCERQTALEQVERATERLDRAESVTGRELPTLRAVGDWLRENAPSDATTTLVHGDFRPGNVPFAETDRPEIAGVLDWETAMLGDPLTELGYLLLRWRDEGDPTPSLDELETRCADEGTIRELREANERGLAPFTAKPGSPSRRELVVRYEEKTGISVENERFYLAHAAFMLATVWEDLRRHRVESGGEPVRGPWVGYATMLADSAVRGEFRL
jgi:aminoglycoside phosphotransferase (APT) family kinase protein